MKLVIPLTPADVLPERDQVLANQEIPPGTTLRPVVEDLLVRAAASFETAASPQGVIARIDQAHFAEVYRGEGLNSTESPLAGIFPKAHFLALFAVTLGTGISETISEAFAQGDFAFGAMLDAYASAAADHGASVVQDRSPTLLDVDKPTREGWELMRYSPGYCGWDISGQRTLFSALGPEVIGITLGSSCLMEPPKSVSGVIVGGPAHIHRFQPGFEFCPDCRTQECRAGSTAGQAGVHATLVEPSPSN